MWYLTLGGRGGVCGTYLTLGVGVVCVWYLTLGGGGGGGGVVCVVSYPWG